MIDCATPACSVALFEDEELISGTFEVLGRGHAERLVPMIADLPERGRASSIAVARGPGSFTGVRIGLAVARSLAFAWGATLQGYSTMALVAAMARQQAGAQALTVAMEGGHGEWFVQGFAEDGSPQAEPVSMRPEEAVASFPASLVAGSVADRFVELAGSGTAIQTYSDAHAFPALDQHALSFETAPIYGRAPDARMPS
ncbi:tRNA (adenosine(37)-N6)-threonylcarbamoyltransferase complex dimerization subunit type 1 TsaB [Alteriqipengyuania lutimaris]|uniref:tRNA (adenosine(37)-N6)-threonylcarbamoyltransferase complex dimerization subunit type 1 TsaB n=1 Tax=Alteriqipengyuania lutimaris TaxID=1538146 RepID=UPI001CFF0CA0|nr:tRNA (adenosine(37)-N6)-threonylcarbamoyltransferase complex dimerization subunit type 1 TsaB [Alteriqipengyuania lutimaris]